MLEALADSFRTFPVNSAISAAIALHTLVSWGGSIFSNALQLSMPVIGTLLMSNAALGILTRSAPQLNILAVGFPITLTIGFASGAAITALHRTATGKYHPRQPKYYTARHAITGQIVIRIYVICSGQPFDSINVVFDEMGLAGKPQSGCSQNCDFSEAPFLANDKFQAPDWCAIHLKMYKVGACKSAKSK